MLRPTALLLALAACNQRAPSPRRLGDVMTQLGRRFELLGRAALAKRWELAAFELGELHETFADVPAAVMPPEITADIPQLAKGFVPAIEGALDPAVGKHDAAAVAIAFAAAAQACNGCHRATGKPFIEIPSELGQPVPRLDPLP